MGSLQGAEEGVYGEQRAWICESRCEGEMRMKRVFHAQRRCSRGGDTHHDHFIAIVTLRARD